MKQLLAILLFFSVVRYAWGENPISIDDFKKIPSASERKEIISKASPEQKEQLTRIEAHLELVKSWGSEETVRWWKESEVAKARGFESLEVVSAVYSNLWSYYIGSQPPSLELELTHEKSADMTRLLVMHSLVFRLAPSTQAANLEKRSALLERELRHRMGEDGSSPHTPLTKSELMTVSRQMDQLVEELKRLPTLTHAQVQKEYDNFPEGRVPIP